MFLCLVSVRILLMFAMSGSNLAPHLYDFVKRVLGKVFAFLYDIAFVVSHVEAEEKGET
jgi:hypothetical protein